MEGTITRLMDRGFGFITPFGEAKDLVQNYYRHGDALLIISQGTIHKALEKDHPDRDLFFHSNNLQNVEFNNLREGDSINFDVLLSSKGLAAVNVAQIREAFEGPTWNAEKAQPESDRAPVTISEVIEVIEERAQLTPELVQHLRNHSTDIDKVNPHVFEHLVGELMASAGWDRVRLVGRNPMTHADIWAIHYTPTSDGIPIRFFVEVKRWKDRIGVEVINQVLGAMVSEREKYGWHVALIVALGGVSTTRTFTQDEYRMKGLEIKDKEDVMRWLRDYKPKGNGLWVPPNFSNEIDTTC